MYQRALVTTDGSEVSRAVLPHVRQVVDPAGTVIVVAVVDAVARLVGRTTPAGFRLGAAAGFNTRFVDEIVEEQRAAATEHLALARETLEQAGFQNVETEILSGLPGEAIVEAAHEFDCDVVLMATHGRSGFRRAVIGSVAEHVLRHLEDIPVVLLRPSEA